MQNALPWLGPRRCSVAATYSELQRRILHWEETGRDGMAPWERGWGGEGRPLLPPPPPPSSVL